MATSRAHRRAASRWPCPRGLGPAGPRAGLLARRPPALASLNSGMAVSSWQGEGTERIAAGPAGPDRGHGRWQGLRTGRQHFLSLPRCYIRRHALATCENRNKPLLAGSCYRPFDQSLLGAEISIDCWPLERACPLVCRAGDHGVPVSERSRGRPADCARHGADAGGHWCAVRPLSGAGHGARLSRGQHRGGVSAIGRSCLPVWR